PTPTPTPPLFPYTTLFRSSKPLAAAPSPSVDTTPRRRTTQTIPVVYPQKKGSGGPSMFKRLFRMVLTIALVGLVLYGAYLYKDEDRKSTRLNSSHVKISYA